MKLTVWSPRQLSPRQTASVARGTQDDGDHVADRADGSQGEVGQRWSLVNTACGQGLQEIKSIYKF